MMRSGSKRKPGFSLWKSIAAAASLYLITSGADGSSQTMIENPDKPSSRNAGRTVVLDEVMRIRDDGKNAVFRNPRYLTLLADGSLIFFDYPFLYKYDKAGKFVFKALKQGKGPGECEHPDLYYINGGIIYVHSWIPPKILEYDLNGRYIGETKTPYNGPFAFLGLIDKRLIGVRDEIRFSEFIHREGFFETPYTLYEISPDYNSLKKIHALPMLHYIKKAHWWRRGAFTAVARQNFLFIVHTSDYRIVKFDLRSGLVERVFKRKYPRLKSGDEGDEQDIYNPVPKQLLPPPLDYVFDILWLRVCRDALWVFTSTAKDGGTKTLVDVFDLEGKYIDCFYLEFPANTEKHGIYNSLVSDDGSIFIPEENQDTGLLSIGEYRIREQPRP